MTPSLSSLRILLIGDAGKAVAMIGYLDQYNMQCGWTRTAQAAIEFIAAFQPAIVITDLALPDTTGDRFIPWLAENTDCGIIVLSEAADESDRVACIEFGADDFVPSPPALRELVARIRAVERRRRPPLAAVPAIATGPTPPVYLLGDLVVCPATLTALDSGRRPFHLTSTEWTVVGLLLETPCSPVSREALCQGALRRPLRAEDRSIDQIVFALRRKLGPDGKQSIVSVRGNGYAARAQLAQLPEPPRNARELAPRLSSVAAA